MYLYHMFALNYNQYSFIPTPSCLNVNLFVDRFHVSSVFLYERSFSSILVIKEKIPRHFDSLWSCACNNYPSCNDFHYYLVSSLIKPILIIFFAFDVFVLHILLHLLVLPFSIVLNIVYIILLS